MEAIMPWIQKQGNIWWIGWRYDGRQYRKSLKTTRKEDAQAELARLEIIQKAKAANALTTDFVEVITGKPVATRPTLHGYLQAWLVDQQAQTRPSTYSKYSQIITEFSKHIGATASDLFLDEVTVDHVKAFLGDRRSQLSASTISGFKRILAIPFDQAQNEGKIRGNPVALVKLGKRTAEAQAMEKRPFTAKEIQALYARATPFWKFMIMGGCYTGQAMGDLITLRRSNVDLDAGMIHLLRRKTGTAANTPIAKPLRDLFVSIWPSKDTDYFWPLEAQRYETTGASSFSQEFFDLMASVGMVQSRDEKKKSSGKGRSARRSGASLGFHNFRHTFVTELKRLGAVESVAKELAGHRSSSISTHYTHLPEQTLADAINKLPEVVK
jgi:integrase